MTTQTAEPTKSAIELSTGSTTIADLLPKAASKHGDWTAVKYKQDDGQWTTQTFQQAADEVAEIARGLIALGIEHGDKVCILADTRYEWTYSEFAIAQAGGVTVPIYPTNSPEECEWVVGNSEAKAIFCADASQLAKIRAVQDKLPALEHCIVFDDGGELGDAITLSQLQARAGEVEQSTLDARIAAVKPEDNFTFIYTSGTTGPPKGCVLTHGNYRSVVTMTERMGAISHGDVIYLFLPLAHGFALLIQLVAFDTGTTLAYFGGDTKQIIQEVAEVKPTYLPSVPRIFEKIYTMATAKAEESGGMKLKIFNRSIKVGRAYHETLAAGKKPGPVLSARYALADKLVLSKVRDLFGGNLRQAVTGAAPISQEILEFFFAAGVPVMEGYGMTESSTASTVCTPDDFKFGTVGKPFPGAQIKIAEDGEILIGGPHVFQGYYRNPEATAETIVDGWLHTGDLGSVDSDGFVHITGRKKDIIITAGGKNLTPANIENDLKQSRWISQAVMHGDRRPFPIALITLDDEEMAGWAKDHGVSADPAELAKNSEVIAMVQAELDKANSKYAQVEQIKKFAILDHDLSQETGELTPTLKVKRNVVNEKYAEIIESLYTG